MFTIEELKTIQALINRASITGQEAIPVAILQQKIQNLIAPISPTKEEAETFKKEITSQTTGTK